MIPNYIVFDIETTQLTSLYDGGRVTCICAKEGGGKHKPYGLVTENESEIILGFIEWLYQFDPGTHTLVSHNGKCFDAQYIYIRLAELTGKTTYFDHLKRFQHFDTFDEYRKKFDKWMSLNKLAAELGLPVQKSADGKQAIAWWHDGEWEKLLKYCFQDVEVTEKVFLAFLERYGMNP